MVSRSHPFKGVTHPTPPVHEPFPLSRRILWPAVQPISPAPSGRVCLVTDPGTPPPAPLPTTLHPSLASSGLLHPDHTPCRLFGPRLHRSCSLTSTQPALGAPAAPHPAQDPAGAGGQVLSSPACQRLEVPPRRLCTLLGHGFVHISRHFPGCWVRFLGPP